MNLEKKLIVSLDTWLKILIFEFNLRGFATVKI